MVGFSRIGEYGRLGNQLHQYALLKAVSVKTGFSIFLPENLESRTHHGQKCLLGNFRLPSATYESFTPNFTFVESGYRNYDDSVFSVRKGTDFVGHFEHQKYATDIRDVLIEEFRLEDKIFDKCRARYESVLGSQKGSNLIASLHIRRGDLEDAPAEENSWSFSFDPGTPYGDYYQSALDKLPSDCNVLVFSGGARLSGDSLVERNRRDLNWCRNNIVKDKRLIFVEDFDDIETLYAMNNVDVNITSYGSTFSWWGSFLNKKSTVFAPKRFFPTEKFSNYSADQFYPPFWKLL
jgi:hypothetical protein